MENDYIFVAVTLSNKTECLFANDLGWTDCKNDFFERSDVISP